MQRKEIVAITFSFSLIKIRYTTMKKTGCDRTPNPIFVRHAGGLKSISTDSIVYMEANACKSFFYLNDGSVVQVEMPLNMALRKMSKIAKTILRIHRSYAVNIEYINMYYNDCFIMHTGKSIPIGREYRKIARANLVSIDKRDRNSSDGDDDEAETVLSRHVIL